MLSPGLVGWASAVKKTPNLFTPVKVEVAILRYYGGKGKLVDFIYDSAVQAAGSDFVLADAFAGTGVVGLAFRKRGHKVLANDILYFSHCLNVSNLHHQGGPFGNFGCIKDAVEALNEVEPETGFLTEHYSDGSTSGRKYFSLSNAMKIDAVRRQVEVWFEKGLIDLAEKEILIGLILRGVNRVSNVTGTYAAFLKSWDPRALKPFALDASEVQIDGPVGKSTNLDVTSFLSTVDAHVLYLDPPYNSREYSSNYFLLELIALGSIPEGLDPRGVTGMVAMTDKKSAFSSKRTARDAFLKLFSGIGSPVSILSYSDEGVVPLEELVEMMASFGSVEVFQRAHKRFRSINQDGSKPTLTEHLMVLRKG
jgi:adenine-specific DNA-methyltransferase